MKSWIKLPFLWLIRFYQKVLSPGFPSACRYTPSCSQYAFDCFDRHHILKAFYLSAHRILRCHPWGGSGYDPAPE
ncbi:MAG: membrane protein insertion efficiency factor YidD [Chitinophagales bacterium]